MNRHHRDVLKVANEAAQTVGWKVKELERRRGDHLAIILTDGTKKRRVFTSNSPSDWRALKNMASTVKKVCREA